MMKETVYKPFNYFFFGIASSLPVVENEINKLRGFISNLKCQETKTNIANWISTTEAEKFKNLQCVTIIFQSFILSYHTYHTLKTR